MYDITQFLPDHPGGDDIVMKYAGQDVGTIMASEDEHVHSRSAYEMLEDYKVGELGGDEKIVSEGEHQCILPGHPADQARLGPSRGLSSRRDRLLGRLQSKQVSGPVKAAPHAGMVCFLDQGVLPLAGTQSSSSERECEVVQVGHLGGESLGNSRHVADPTGPDANQVVGCTDVLGSNHHVPLHFVGHAIHRSVSLASQSTVHRTDVQVDHLQ